MAATYIAKSQYQLQLAGVPGYSERWTMMSEITLPRERTTFKDGDGGTIVLLGLLKPGDNPITFEKPYDVSADPVLINWHKQPAYPENGLVATITPKSTDGKLILKYRIVLKGVFISSLTIPSIDLNQTTPEVGRMTMEIVYKTLELGEGVGT